MFFAIFSFSKFYKKLDFFFPCRRRAAVAAAAAAAAAAATAAAAAVAAAAETLFFNHFFRFLAAVRSTPPKIGKNAWPGPPPRRFYALVLHGGVESSQDP